MYTFVKFGVRGAGVKMRRRTAAQTCRPPGLAPEKIVTQLPLNEKAVCLVKCLTSL